jgi:hypothetical protein
MGSGFRLVNDVTNSQVLSEEAMELERVCPFFLGLPHTGSGCLSFYSEKPETSRENAAVLQFL